MSMNRCSSRTRRIFFKTSSSPRTPTPGASSKAFWPERMQALTGGLPLPPGLKLF